MKKQNKNIREPYEPEKTPKPPQIIEPNSGRQRENPVENKERREETTDKPTAKPTTEKHHLLSEDADIDDETTV